jgi:thioredoxin 1
MVRELESDSEFRQSVTERPGWVVVDYYAQWCGPCKRFSPTYERLSKEWSSVSFYKVDVDVSEISETVSKQGVECMPTFVLYKDGNEWGRITGADEKNLLKMLENSLNQ